MDESLPGVRISCEVRREEFERHGSLEASVFGLVDDTHAAFAELLEDLVVRNHLANHGNSPRE